MSTELNHFDPNTPVAFTKRQMKAAAASGEPTFVRACRIFGIEADSIEEVVTTAEDQLNRVADECGLLVIKHQWGLYSPEKKPPNSRLKPPYVWPKRLLPPNTILVAEVDALQDTQRLNREERHDLQERLDTHYGTELRKGGQVMADLLYAGQTVKGTSPEGIHGEWIVDIDPRIASADCLQAFYGKRAFQ